jgi:hypothetical protein
MTEVGEWREEALEYARHVGAPQSVIERIEQFASDEPGYEDADFPPPQEFVDQEMYDVIVGVKESRLREIFAIDEDVAIGPQAFSQRPIEPHVDPTELEDPDMYIAFTPEEAEYMLHAVSEYKTSNSDPVKKTVIQKLEFNVGKGKETR